MNYSNNVPTLPAIMILKNKLFLLSQLCWLLLACNNSDAPVSNTQNSIPEKDSITELVKATAKGKGRLLIFINNQDNIEDWIKYRKIIGIGHNWDIYEAQSIPVF